MTLEKRVATLRRNMEQWFADLKDKTNGYRCKLVIPSGLYKGLGWGMYWCAYKLWGGNTANPLEDPETGTMARIVDALIRLDKAQQKNNPQVLGWKKKWAQEHLLRAMHKPHIPCDGCDECEEAWRLLEFQLRISPMEIIAKNKGSK